MPTNYVRKSNRKSWTNQRMEEAVKAVMEGSPVKTAALNYCIPRTTLIRHLKNLNKTSKLGPLPTVFSQQQEQELVRHLLDLEKRFYGLTMTEIKKMAFELAEKNGLKHSFNKSTQMAGKAWLSGFLKRNPNLSFRMPEATSAARARGFNKISVAAFYDLLEDILRDPKITANRIFNADETSVCTVPPKKRKVGAQKGKKQVGGITSAERGQTVTALMCMSASGQHLPPFLIFPRLKMHEALKKGAPYGTKFSCNASGYMDLNIYSDWFDHFVENVRPSEDNPALLIIDGHSSHTKNLAFIEKARGNFVTVLVLPPHCSNKLQPLDVTFMAPFKSYYAAEVERFLKLHPGRVVGQYEITELMTPAFMKTATINVAINGFSKTGIWPFNRHQFDDDAFAPSTVTEQPPPQPDQPDDLVPDCGNPSNGGRSSCDDKGVQVDLKDFVAYLKSRSNSRPLFQVAPSAISPLPKMITPRVTKRKRHGEKATDITSDLYSDSLKKVKASKDIQAIKKEHKTRMRKTKDKSSCRANTSSDSLCEMCGDQFSNSDAGTGWQLCLQCLNWFHSGCLTVARTICHNCS